jgi:hypothetical protein
MDTRTDAERRYDAERDGTLYVKEDDRIAIARECDRIIAEDRAARAADDEHPSAALVPILEQIEAHFERKEDEPLHDDDRQIIEAILAAADERQAAGRAPLLDAIRDLAEDIRIEPLFTTEERDLNYGKQEGTRFSLGDVELVLPVEPRDLAYLRLGSREIDLEEALDELDHLYLLLNDYRVTPYLDRWENG